MNELLDLSKLEPESVQAGRAAETVATIMQLEKEIARILYSQVTMRKANRALKAGSGETLLQMAFSRAHVLELASRVESGGVAFPEYAFRNNANLIRSLRQRQAMLAEQLPHGAVGAAQVAPRPRLSCRTEQVSAVPFLAACMPFIL